MEKFKYLEVTVTNKNDMCKDIKLRINMENACYYSLKKHLSFHLLSNKLKVNIILSVVFENKVLRKIFGAKRNEITRKMEKVT